MRRVHSGGRSVRIFRVDLVICSLASPAPGRCRRVWGVEHAAVKARLLLELDRYGWAGHAHLLHAEVLGEARVILALDVGANLLGWLGWRYRGKGSKGCCGFGIRREHAWFEHHRPGPPYKYRLIKCTA